jgi:DNA-binding transcriptional ArsR family regulator
VIADRSARSLAVKEPFEEDVSKLNVSSAVDALALAGLIEARSVGNERRIRLAPVELLPGLRAPVKQPDWVGTFGVALEVLRFQRRDDGSSSVRAIEARRLVERLRTHIASAGLPEPNLAAVGDDFGVAFDRWIVDLVYHLRLRG